MSEATPETAAPAQEQSTPAAAAEPPPSWDELFKGEDPAKVKEALENSRRWESRAKSNSEAAKKVAEIEKQRQAEMTEAERAVVEAETRGRTAAAQEYGKRLVTSEIRAAAATTGVDLGNDLEYVDLARFLDEDNEPNGKAIQQWLDAKPKKDSGTTSFDGGARTSPPAPQNMTGLIRKAAGRA